MEDELAGVPARPRDARDRAARRVARGGEPLGVRGEPARPLARRAGGRLPPASDRGAAALPAPRRAVGVGPAAGRACPATGRPRGLRHRRRRPALHARLPPGSQRIERRVGTTAHRSPRSGARSRRRRARDRRRRRGHRGRGRRGLPGGGAPALLDPSRPQHPRGTAGCRAALVPARPAPHLPRPPTARTRRPAVGAYWRGATAWRARHPGLVRRLERDLDDLLAVFGLPEHLRPSLRSTNLIERAFREIRRRIRPIGSLSDRRSADRILYGQVVRLNELLAGRPLGHSHRTLDVIAIDLRGAQRRHRVLS